MPMKLKVGPPVKSGTQDEEGLYPLEAQPCIGKRVGHGRWSEWMPFYKILKRFGLDEAMRRVQKRQSRQGGTPKTPVSGSSRWWSPRHTVWRSKAPPRPPRVEDPWCAVLLLPKFLPPWVQFPEMASSFNYGPLPKFPNSFYPEALEYWISMVRCNHQGWTLKG